jgi:regulator of sigma E protease
MTILLQIGIGLAILGILVFIHELGHFLMAKACNIRVLAFSIGFGKPIINKKFHETEYRIGTIPFGGYVSMAGEHPEEGSTVSPGDFNSKPVWQRALVAIAGPASNFLFSIIFLWTMFMIGVDKPTYLDRPVVGAVADSSFAKDAGVLPGDSIISVNGRPTHTWEDVQTAISSGSTSLQMILSRNNRIDSINFAVAKITGRGLPRHPAAGLYAPLPAIIGSLSPGSPAQKAGLKAHDTVISINDEPIHSWFQLSARIAQYSGNNVPLDFKVHRVDSTLSIRIIPEFKKDLNRFLIGAAVMSPPVKSIRYSFSESMFKTLNKSWEYTIMIFDVVAKLISKQVSPQQLAGPIGIVQMSGVVAMGGIAAILDFMALIGINLAVINLLPLVITDGGLLLLLVVESVRRKPLAARYQMIINRIAIAFFITLFIYVTFNDLLRIPELLRLAK